MRTSVYRLFVLSFISTMFWLSPANAQERKGTITGHALDTNKEPLVGALVELQPLGRSVSSGDHGQFTLSDVAPGKYTLAISYVGFTSFSKEVTVTSAGVENVEAELQIATVTEQVIVRGERERGEIEALNRERTADNIIQVLPAEVITSLPNTNIADAVGRMPSVSLERDEGEGKYVQIRGTEPRLSNVTMDGVHVPSPETTRNVKLDVIPSDLVESVEVSKTLSADQEGDAIGGSVNLVTKKAYDQPYVTLFGLGGYTPIDNGRGLYQFGGTIGKRFGRDKRFGLLVNGTYDWNGRGTDDVEPSPVVRTDVDGAPPRALSDGNSMRLYWYDRARTGFAASTDYRLNSKSFVYARGFFSQFNDNGEDWIYALNTGTFSNPNTTTADADGNTAFTDVIRDPWQQVFNVTAGAQHTFGSTMLAYEVTGGQARDVFGFPSFRFGGPQAVSFGYDTSQPFNPQFPVQNGVDIFDPNLYTLNRIRKGSAYTKERDYTGSMWMTRQYTAGSNYGTFAMGFKLRDADKTNLDLRRSFNVNNSLNMSTALRNITNPDYHLGAYKFGPVSDRRAVQAFVNANPGTLTPRLIVDQLANDPNNFDTRERVIAGYAMNTISIGHIRIQGGVRFEETQDTFVGTSATGTKDPITGIVTAVVDTPAPGAHSYLDVLPSVQFQYSWAGNTKLRFVYGRGIARADFSDLPPFERVDNTRRLTIVSLGNPNLKPTHANNYDVLFEHYLKSVGIIEAGWFYKDLKDPIFGITTNPTTGKFAGDRVDQTINGPSAHIQGIEVAWQQHLTFLPGLLHGLGVSANYSYTASQVNFPANFLNRKDHPRLNRTAPNNWNFDATYDKGPITARMGLSHNDAYISSYQWEDGDLTQPTLANDPVLGLRGPSGDEHIFPHTQVDAQVSYRLPRRMHDFQAIVSMLNLNNEVFGFYFGSEKYPTQREYYKTTISIGLRWTPSFEKK
jgi:TonB-dependent receptor